MQLKGVCNFLIEIEDRKKRTIRSLWIVRINAAVREHGLDYSTFVNLLKNKKYYDE